MKKLLLAALAALGILSAPAHAAQDQVLAFVVTTCGTLATPYIAGKYGILTMDVNGKLCDSSSGGGGGGTSATFGATFPATGTPVGGTDGTNFQPLVVDTTTHYLQVDVKAGGAGGGAVFGPTAVGSAAANPPVQVGGTVDGTATGNIQAWKVVSGVGFISAVVPSGGVASGAVASGAYASGSIGSGAMVDLGAIADAAATAGSTGTASAKLRLMTTQLGTINTTLGTPFQAGGNIGNTTFAVTNAGTFSTQISAQTGWAGGTLGAMAAYGTSPGAVLVPGVNAFVTNTNSNGAATSANSGPVVIATDQAGTCTSHAFKHITSATDTLAVQGVSAQTVRLCAWIARAAGTATWYWENTASTNANCSSTLTQISGVNTEAANTGISASLPFGITLNNTSANGLCINSTGTGGVDIDFWYAQR